jgi:adenylate cyclase
MTQTRRLAAILAADVAGYSRLMGVDEEGTLERLKALRVELVDPKIAEHHGRIVKTTGDGLLVEFGSVVDAMRCAIGWQAELADHPQSAHMRIDFRIGVNLGDIIIDGDDIFGDGVNIAARLEEMAEPGGICIERTVLTQTRGKLDFAVEDLGDQALKNIAQPVHVFRVVAEKTRMPEPPVPAPPLPDKPSIAVLPFQNISGDPEQEYFADGMVEEIITALSRIRWLFVIARNSSFVYKGQSVDVKQVGRELGVRYVLEGSVRKGGNRVRITAQLIDAASGAHLWADRFDGLIEEVFELQDEVAIRVCSTARSPATRATVRRSPGPRSVTSGFASTVGRRTLRRVAARRWLWSSRHWLSATRIRACSPTRLMCSAFPAKTSTRPLPSSTAPSLSIPAMLAAGTPAALCARVSATTTRQSSIWKNRYG